MELDAKIESILFFKAEPVSVRELAALFGETEERVAESLAILASKLEGRGIVLIRKEGEALLGTAPGMSDTIERLRKEDLGKELSKSALETLSVILYKEGATRSDIDYIRGVNSTVALRNLLIRGLVEKEAHKDDSRKFFYKPSFALFEYLGIRSIEELPEYETVRGALAKPLSAPGEQKQNKDTGSPS